MIMMQPDWHSADIIAALKKRGTSLTALSRNSGLAEDREKTSEARQAVIHKMTKKSTNNSISRKKVSPFHSYKTVVISLLPYAVVDSAQSFMT
ncbi:transcriptional regulator [Salmonella enterica]|nr:transcriptional regulator [Salmonella enterica]